MTIDVDRPQSLPAIVATPCSVKAGAIMIAIGTSHHGENGRVVISMGREALACTAILAVGMLTFANTTMAAKDNPNPAPGEVTRKSGEITTCTRRAARIKTYMA
jgi:hypothetical protein